MARATTKTKLTLDRWAQIIGFNPLHFNGVDLANQQLICEEVWQQYAWQNASRIGREEVAEAIARAEADIERVVGYRLLPSWETDEWLPTASTPSPELLRTSLSNVRGYAQTVEAKWGWMISGGIRSKSLIEAGSAVTYTDVNLDGYKETATVTIASAFSPCEIKVYFPGYSGDDAYEIRPIKITESSGTLTITFRRELAVKPTLQDESEPLPDDTEFRGVDGDTDSNFITTVDVYRVYNDPQQQATLMWQPFNRGCTACDSSGCPTCSYNVQGACLLLVGDPKNGVVSYSPADWDSTTMQFNVTALAESRQPDIARLYYYSGYRNKSLSCPTVNMDPDFERLVTYLSVAYLERPICACNNVASFVDHWQHEMAATGTERGISISAYDRDCPFGTTRGAIHVWRRLMQEGMTLGRGVYVR